MELLVEEDKQSLENRSLQALPKQLFLRLKAEFLGPYENSKEILYLVPRKKQNDEEQDMVIDNSHSDIQSSVDSFLEYLDLKNKASNASLPGPTINKKIMENRSV